METKPSWTSSPAVRSPKTWANFQSSGCDPSATGAVASSPPPIISLSILSARKYKTQMHKPVDLRNSDSPLHESRRFTKCSLVLHRSFLSLSNHDEQTFHYLSLYIKLCVSNSHRWDFQSRSVALWKKNQSLCLCRLKIDEISLTHRQTHTHTLSLSFFLYFFYLFIYLFLFFLGWWLMRWQKWEWKRTTEQRKRRSFVGDYVSLNY